MKNSSIVALHKDKKKTAENSAAFQKILSYLLKIYFIIAWYSCRDFTPPSPPLPFLTASIP